MEDEIKEELIDQPLDGYSGPEGLVGPEGLLAELKKRLMNRVLDAELTAHLGRGSMPGPMAGTSATARRFDGFDEVIVSLRSRGLAVRDVQERLLGMHKVEVSPMLIPNATEAVAEVSNRAVCLALAIAMEGRREALGMRSSQSEGSKFWLNVLTELKGGAYPASWYAAWTACPACPRPSRRST